MLSSVRAAARRAILSSSRSSVIVRPTLTNKTNARVSLRSYGTITATDQYVIKHYELEPRRLEASLRENESDVGPRYAAKLRKEERMIPGVVQRASEPSYLIKIDPRQIQSIMDQPNSRFMGRRYTLFVADTKEELEVIPQQLVVTPNGYVPLSVTFSLFNPNRIPEPIIEERIQKKMFHGLGLRKDAAGNKRSRAEQEAELAKVVM